MSKMTKEELKRRKAELKKIAHAEIIKREVMQFRLEPENIEKLYRIAAQKRKPVGTLVREWMIERINTEPISKTGKSIARDSGTALAAFDLAIDKLRSEIQEPLIELGKRMSIVEEMARHNEHRGLK